VKLHEFVVDLNWTEVGDTRPSSWHGKSACPYIVALHFLCEEAANVGPNTMVYEGARQKSRLLFTPMKPYELGSLEKP
jgi:hypothetical protein